MNGKLVNCMMYPHSSNEYQPESVNRVFFRNVLSKMIIPLISRSFAPFEYALLDFFVLFDRLKLLLATC